nr:MAG: pVIII protein [unidentified adenovirus]
MSRGASTPYVWSYQPQLGSAAGASQDYSTRVNWLAGGLDTYRKIQHLNAIQNAILNKQKLLSETVRPVRNPLIWPAANIILDAPTPSIVKLSRDESAEREITASGAQLTGGSLQLNDHLPKKRNKFLPEGTEQLTGGGIEDVFLPQETTVIFSGASSSPYKGGIGWRQFLNEFVPFAEAYPFLTSTAFPHDLASNFNTYKNRYDDYS